MLQIRKQNIIINKTVEITIVYVQNFLLSNCASKYFLILLVDSTMNRSNWVVERSR